MKKYKILGVHWKTKTNIEGRDCLKGRGEGGGRGLGQFADLRGGLGRKEGGGAFEGGDWYPMHTMPPFEFNSRSFNYSMPKEGSSGVTDEKNSMQSTDMNINLIRSFLF